jgi:hypothetical protein
MRVGRLQQERGEVEAALLGVRIVAVGAICLDERLQWRRGDRWLNNKADDDRRDTGRPSQETSASDDRVWAAGGVHADATTRDRTHLFDGPRNPPE